MSPCEDDVMTPEEGLIKNLLGAGSSPMIEYVTLLYGD